MLKPAAVQAEHLGAVLQAKTRAGFGIRARGVADDECQLFIPRKQCDFYRLGAVGIAA